MPANVSTTESIGDEHSLVSYPLTGMTIIDSHQQTQSYLTKYQWRNCVGNWNSVAFHNAAITSYMIN